MLKKTLVLFLLLIAQIASADENLFAANYHAQNNGNLQSLQASPDTKMYVSNHKEDDNISMLENGYDLMGSSSFEAGNVPAELALAHARSIKADTVLVYSKYASKQMALSKIEAIKQAAKGSHEVDASVLKQDEEQYKYFASYWAKIPTPLLGLHVIKLKTKEGEPLDGLKVLAVIKDSPAAKVNLMRGDVLLKIGEVTLQKPEELSLAARQYQGKKVEITYEREGESAVTTATLNSR
ncbi:MAG: PDZ domain-containing protein [Methylophilaceae bacterium]